MKTPFTYTVVRYGPDAVSGEFVNVGVVVYAPKAHFLRAKCTTRYGRISRFIGEIDGQHFRQMMNHIEHGVRNIEKSFSTLISEAPADVVQALRHVISIEDVTITYAEPKGGLTRDAAKTLEDVYHRFVGRHEEDTRRRGRQDADVWRSFREELDEAGVLPALKPYRVEAPLLSYDFEHAWKNGTWHALEPVSFDLLDPIQLRTRQTSGSEERRILARHRNPYGFSTSWECPPRERSFSRRTTELSRFWIRAHLLTNS